MNDGVVSSMRETNDKLDLQNHFPMPKQSVEAKPRPRTIMRKMHKKPSQKMRRTCDGDGMKTEKLATILELHSGHNIAKQRDVKIMQSAEIDIPESTDDRPRQRRSRENKKFDLVSSFAKDAKEAMRCTEGCGCPHADGPAQDSAEQEVRNQSIEDEMPR